MMAVTVFLGEDGIFDAEFLADREKMVPGTDFSKAKLIVPAKLMQLQSNLARLEAQVAVGALLRKTSSFELSTDEELPLHPSPVFRSVTELPMRLAAT